MELIDFLARLYDKRFNEQEKKERLLVWKTICERFLQKYISENASVLDIGAGYGEFINHIRCKEKYAVDLNDKCRDFLNSDVRFFKCPSSALSFLPDRAIEVVFMSNFSEHLRSKQELVDTFIEARRVLASGGKLLILGPNIRYAYQRYWDFFDHHIPLSERGVCEALRAIDFKIEQVIPRFLPFTTKSRLPKNSLAVRLYLKLPFIWPILGRQMFIVATK
jgi:ubiquinone/menaquinone biosynthesis C-methylase UbiE